MPVVALVTSVKLNAAGPAADAVVTVQVPEVVEPTVAVAVAAVPALALDVSRMAIVSPALKPAIVVPPQLPLREPGWPMGLAAGRALALDVSRMATVSPPLKPAIVGPPQLPLRAIADLV